MIESVVIFCFLAVALLFTLLACTSRTAERLLWGSVLCSLGLGLAVQFSGRSYYGLMMLGAFLATDLVLYLYFRTQNLLPTRVPRNQRADRLYRIFFLWLGACAVLGGALTLFQVNFSLPPLGERADGLKLLHDRIWEDDWLLVTVPVITLVGMVTGGFFLVRKEQ